MSVTWHVSVVGDDGNDGSVGRPLRSIQAAAERAQAGDTILVSAGVYRERVDPPRGGTSAAAPITYAAVPGEHVVLTGSDMFTGWSPAGDGLWELVVPSSYFGDFNPYAEVVHGDWFVGMGRVHRRGNVFLDGAWLPEVVSPEALRTGAGLGWASTVDGLIDRPMTPWYEPEGRAAYDPAVFDPSGNTTILARFPEGVDPNGGRVEVAVRATVFTPTAEHIDYITVRGFEIRNAATNWVAPTAGQEGLVTAYWCRGWVIEDNEICYSRCAGIALAKNHDEFDGERGTTDGYYSTITDALDRDGWSKDTIGSHTVRNNHIHHCGEVGIVGSLGGAFSTIEGNDIHDCNLQGIWTGAEMAGIKLHGAIDVTIAHNHIHRCGDAGGIWLDWMAQGTRVTGNLLHDNAYDIVAEANHGPILIADNILLSHRGLLSNSRGLAVAHNLMTGTLSVLGDPRETPYLKHHSTEPVTLRRVCDIGDAQWINNTLGPHVDLQQYDASDPDLPCVLQGNVTINPLDDLTQRVAPQLVQTGDSWWLTMHTPTEWQDTEPGVSTDSLAIAVVPQQPFTAPDGSPVRLDHDYLGMHRADLVTPGPFARPLVGSIQVWPR